MQAHFIKSHKKRSEYFSNRVVYKYKQGIKEILYDFAKGRPIVFWGRNNAEGTGEIFLLLNVS